MKREKNVNIFILSAIFLLGTGQLLAKAFEGEGAGECIAYVHALKHKFGLPHPPAVSNVHAMSILPKVR